MLNKNILFVVFFWILTVSIFAQQADNSPYSRFGIGDITDTNFNHLRQMGGLGASFIDPYHINIINPAALSFLNATAFDVGVFGKRTILADKQNTTKIWSGNLEYISLAFPLRNPINEVYDGVKKDYRLGMAFTLMPHSNVSYNISSLDSISGVNAFTRNYAGSGGTYKFMWSNAIKYKKLAFGVNLGYLFGQINNDRKIFFNSSDYAFNDLFYNNYNVKGFLWNVGMIYSKVLNEGQILKDKNYPAKRISIGVHFNSANAFSTTGTQSDLLVQQFSSSVSKTDTISYLEGVSGKGKLPAELGLGFTYYAGEKSAIGVNYVSNFWSSYYNTSNGEKVGDLKNASKVSIGGYFRPNYKSFDHFFQRVYYRYGIYYQTDPRVINNEQITSYGVTMGMGMPFVFQRKISHVNIGANFGIRGQNTPISEKFVKISFGVTFNDDEWFLKRKYN